MLASLHHWLSEVRARSTSTDVEAALAGVPITREGNVARIGEGIFTAIPTSQGRSRALAGAAAIARNVLVHAPTAPSGAFLRGRLAIDLPRIALRAAGLPAAEPGDRFAGSFVHVFFDDEAIATEAARAGLAFVARDGAWVALKRTERGEGDERADPFRRELLRALLFIGTAERLRAKSPEAAVQSMRQRGRRAHARGVVGRARLRRAIAWVDAAFPGGPNCFRRVLTEIALDHAAALEPLVFGLDLGRTGHVAFAGTEERSFDVAFEIR